MKPWGLVHCCLTPTSCQSWNPASWRKENCRWKRTKLLLKTKDAMWSCWKTEYFCAFYKHHCLKHGDKRCSLAVGDVFIILSHLSAWTSNWSLCHHFEVFAVKICALDRGILDSSFLIYDLIVYNFYNTFLLWLPRLFNKKKYMEANQEIWGACGIWTF